MNPEGRVGPSLQRFNHLPLSAESISQREAYLEAYRLAVAPFLAERSALTVDLEDAQMRFDALRRGAGQDAELARLRAELAALNGDNPTETPAEPAQMQLAEAAATVGRLKAQLENLETRIRQADEELLRIHGAA